VLSSNIKFDINIYDKVPSDVSYYEQIILRSAIRSSSPLTDHSTISLQHHLDSNYNIYPGDDVTYTWLNLLKNTYYQWFVEMTYGTTTINSDVWGFLTQNFDGACFYDSDCGRNQWLNTTYCLAGDIWQDYRDYTCLDSGTVNASCDYTDSPQKKQTCEDGCTNGTCNPIECYSNSECGTNKWIGSKFCNTDDIFQTYRTYECHNKGTAASYCDYVEEDKLRKECDYGCQDGVCLSPNITCSINSDCGTDGLVGSKYCLAGDSYRNYRTWTCNNPGTPTAYCSYSDASQLIDSCAGDCVNGNCVVNACNLNSDCGTDQWLEMPYCIGDNVYQLYRTWICEIPGTDSCNYTDTDELKELCNYTCLNGVCVDQEEQSTFDADIGVRYFLVQTPNPTAGNFTVLAFNMQNNGNISVNDIEWQLSSGEGTIINGVVSELKVGQGQIVMRKVTYSAPGTYNAEIIIDPNNNIDEFDESNNQEVVSVNVE